jgi:hypothetical protein
MRRDCLDNLHGIHSGARTRTARARVARPRAAQPGARGLRSSILTQPNYQVDLAAVRTRGGYLELLGSETRAQIRRSGREYQTLGGVTVRAAADSDAATASLAALKALHQPYWIARGNPGEFASPYFEQFHDRLVQACVRTWGDSIAGRRDRQPAARLSV